MEEINELQQQIARQNTRIEALEADRERLFQMVDDCITSVQALREAGLQPASTLVQWEGRLVAEKNRLTAEVARLDQKIDATIARRDLVSTYRERLGLEGPRDLARAKCTYCGRQLRDAHGRASHENRCEKNPATATQAWQCRCGTTGISNTGLGRHVKRCSLAVGDKLLMGTDKLPSDLAGPLLIVAQGQADISEGVTLG